MRSDQLSVLAVDKDVHMLELLERIVKDKTPYQIITTANSLEVPDFLDEHQFDLVISDLKMPGFNGVDLLKTVRERKSNEKIIIITASGDFESAMECMSLGAFNYILKPFSKKQIISEVESAMQIQLSNKKAELLSKLVESFPLLDAVKQFEKHYIEMLDQRFNGDIQKMSKTSGLSKHKLRKLISEKANKKNNIET